MSEHPSIDVPAAVPPKKQRWYSRVIQEKKQYKKDLNTIKGEKIIEDVRIGSPEKSPITYETQRMFRRVIDALPDDASKALVASWERKTKIGIMLSDLLLNAGDLAVNILILRQLFHLTYANVSRPLHDEILSGKRNPLSMVLYHDVQKHKPLVSVDFQIVNPKLIPYVVGEKIMYGLRRRPIKYVADQFEAYARSEKGRKKLLEIAKKKGFGTSDAVVQNIVNGNKDAASLVTNNKPDILDNQVHYGAGKVV